MLNPCASVDGSSPARIALLSKPAQVEVANGPTTRFACCSPNSDCRWGLTFWWRSPPPVTKFPCRVDTILPCLLGTGARPCVLNLKSKPFMPAKSSTAAGTPPLSAKCNCRWRVGDAAVPGGAGTVAEAVELRDETLITTSARVSSKPSTM